jgi:hypothetical protein
MDTVFFIIMSLIDFATVVVIIIMIYNRLKGRDEFDGMPAFKCPKKDQE